MNYELQVILLLVAASTIVYAVRAAYVMRGAPKASNYKADIIVTEEDKKNIFSNISMAFYMGAILAFVFEYSSALGGDSSLKVALIKSFSLISIGLIIRIIQNIKKQSLKENLTKIVLVLSIPIALLQFFEYGSVTIWAFPMIIIITSIIFSKRTLLIATTVVAIMTQIWIWMLRPEVVVVVDKYDYIGRIGLFIVAFLMGAYINKLYVAKIRENEFQAKFQKMNAKISSDFIRINKENIDSKINKMLGEMGLFFNPDRISLFAINEEDGEIRYSHEWCNEGVDSKIENFESVASAKVPWWINKLKNNKVISIGDTRIMPMGTNNEQEQLNKLDIKSVVSVPIEGENGINDFLVISSVDTYRKWPEEDIKLLHILANLLSDALLKIKSEDEVEYMAYYDGLTNLPNRFLFKNRVGKAINSTKKKEGLVSVMFIDIDNFKSVNGIIGYEGGDKLLKEVSQRLEEAVGEQGEVARFSGDEFMIRLKGVEIYKDILKTADKVMKSFAQPFNVRGQEFLITCSAGISSYPMDGENPDILIENANIAMQYAKDKGKSQYALCTPNMKEEAQMNMTLLNDLYGALQREELVIYYQPQVSMITGKINGAEALIRWNHPDRGIISPAIFIPLAEKHGLINDIGKWVLKTACIQNKKWQDMNLKPMTIGVNLSAVQLIDVNLVSFTQNVLRETGLDPKYLELEITESVTIEEVGYIEKILNQFKKMGIAIAIDDFGTEHSSFSRLKTLPIDRIKIDMQFIQGIEESKKDRTITKIMISLAKGLGVNVIAEGVETKVQLDFLKEKECDDVQGYYYYKPMPAKELEELLVYIK